MPEGDGVVAGRVDAVADCHRALAVAGHAVTAGVHRAGGVGEAYGDRAEPAGVVAGARREGGSPPRLVTAAEGGCVHACDLGLVAEGEGAERARHRLIPAGPRVE